MNHSLKVSTLLAAMVLSACGRIPVSHFSDDEFARKYFLGTTQVVGGDGDNATENILFVRQSKPESQTVEAIVRTWTNLDSISASHLSMKITAASAFDLSGIYLGEEIAGSGEFTGDTYGDWQTWEYGGTLVSDPSISTKTNASLNSEGEIESLTNVYFDGGVEPVVVISDKMIEKDPATDAEFAELVRRVFAESISK